MKVMACTHESTDGVLYLLPRTPQQTIAKEPSIWQIAAQHFGVYSEHTNTRWGVKAKAVEMTEREFYSLPEFDG
jgi:hypothetical protein